MDMSLARTRQHRLDKQGRVPPTTRRRAPRGEAEILLAVGANEVGFECLRYSPTKRGRVREHLVDRGFREQGSNVCEPLVSGTRSAPPSGMRSTPL